MWLLLDWLTDSLLIERISAATGDAFCFVFIFCSNTSWYRVSLPSWKTSFLILEDLVLIEEGVFRTGPGAVRCLPFGVAALPTFLLFAIWAVLASFDFLPYNYEAPSLSLPFRRRSIVASTFTTVIVFLVAFFIFSLFLAFDRFSEFLMALEFTWSAFDFEDCKFRVVSTFTYFLSSPLLPFKWWIICLIRFVFSSVVDYYLSVLAPLYLLLSRLLFCALSACLTLMFFITFRKLNAIRFFSSSAFFMLRASTCLVLYWTCGWRLFWLWSEIVIFP